MPVGSMTNVPDAIEKLPAAALEANSAALLKAALRGDASAVGALLEARADPNFRSGSTGSTPLHRAAAKRHEEAVRKGTNGVNTVWVAAWFNMFV